MKLNKRGSVMEDSDIDTDSSCEEESFATRNIRAANGTKYRNAIKMRPNASAGYWLCTLMPLAMASHYYHHNCENVDKSIYSFLTVAAIGMCIQSFCFFLYLSLDVIFFVKLILSLIPGICTSILYCQLLNMSWPVAIIFGFFVTFAYQNSYVRVLKGFPNTFSYGEASIIMQGLMLFTYKTLWVLWSHESEHGSLATELNHVVMYGLASLGAAIVAFSKYPKLRSPCGFYAVIAVLAVVLLCFPISQPIPIIALYKFLMKRKERVYIICFYFALVGFTISTVWWQLRNATKASTRVRKIFHILILLVYVPGMLYDSELLHIASCVALAVLIVLEAMRVMNIPPLAIYMRRAFAVFADEKDAGVLALTPFCLLIGCSLPLWISPLACDSGNGSILAAMSGILAVGVGDTAASVIGSRVGRTKWRYSSRSLEGTAAFITSVVATIVVFYLTGYITMTQGSWFIVIVATINTALVEALTDQIDNIVLPLVFYTFVNLS